MKLIYCPHCHDITRLIVNRKRYCLCKQSHGMYCSDGLHALVGGLAIPMGISNISFAQALSRRDESGHVEKFEAFIIEKNCKTVAAG